MKKKKSEEQKEDIDLKLTRASDFLELPIKDNYDESLQISRLAAFLDFYSDRATAHASLFVASLFGLFTQLAIVQAMVSDYPIWVVWLSIPIFYSLAYAGYFTLVRFGFYANISQRITIGLEETFTFKKVFFSERGKKIDLCSYLNKQSSIQRKILFPKEVIRKLRNKGLALLAFSYWLIVIWFGALVYSQHLQNVEWLLWFAFTFIFVLVFVIIPLPKLYYDSKNEKKPKKNKDNTCTCT